MEKKCFKKYGGEVGGEIEAPEKRSFATQVLHIHLFLIPFVSPLRLSYSNPLLILSCTNNKPRIVDRGLRYSFYRQRFSLCCDLSNHEPSNPRIIIRGLLLVQPTISILDLIIRVPK